jgi:hypothetical protein
MSKESKKTLKKCDDLISALSSLKKGALKLVPPLSSAQSPPNTQEEYSEVPLPHVGPGWHQDTRTGALTHADHGLIHVVKRNDGAFDIYHHEKNPAQTLTGGVTRAKRYVSTAKDINEAGKYMMSYASRLRKSIEDAHNDAKPWINHNNIPSAYENKAQIAKDQQSEDKLAIELAKTLFANSAMGGQQALQPSDQKLFNQSLVSDEQARAADQKWQNTFNWLQEASKPINSKFKSEQEEIEYWNSIKISDSDDNSSGY